MIFSDLDSFSEIFNHTMYHMAYLQQYECKNEVLKESGCMWSRKYVHA